MPTNFITGPLQAGDLVKGIEIDPKSGLPVLYAHIAVAKGKANERQTGGAYKDFRTITITTRGLRPAVGTSLSYQQGTFNLSLLPTSLNQTPTLPMPSGAPFLRWWPGNDGDVAIEKTRKDAHEIWQAVLTGEVTTIRQGGGLGDPVDIDGDVQAAVVALWNKTPGLGVADSGAGGGLLASTIDLSSSFT